MHRVFLHLLFLSVVFFERCIGRLCICVFFLSFFWWGGRSASPPDALGVSGLFQSAYRAELQAVCCAVQYALFWQRKVRVWSDCQSMVQRFTQLVHHNRVLKPNGPHYDLWSQILDVVDRLGVASIRITKVAAHQDVSVVPSAFANWAFQHNIVVDRAARLTNLQRDSSFWALHRHHSLASQRAQQVSHAVQSVILAISKKVVAREVVLLQDETDLAVIQEHVEPVMVAPPPDKNMTF